MRLKPICIKTQFFMLLARNSCHLNLTTIISKSFESPIFLITFS